MIIKKNFFKKKFFSPFFFTLKILGLRKFSVKKKKKNFFSWNKKVSFWSKMKGSEEIFEKFLTVKEIQSFEVWNNAYISERINHFQSVLYLRPLSGSLGGKPGFLLYHQPPSVIHIHLYMHYFKLQTTVSP